MPALESPARIALFCEGKDDKAFLEWVIAEASIPAIVVMPLNGVDKPEARMQALLQTHFDEVRPVKVAFVLDSDENADQKREAVKYALSKVAPLSEAIIYFLPNDDNDGMLEDLLLRSSTNQSLVRCAESFVECARSAHPKSFNEAKVKLHIYRTGSMTFFMGDAKFEWVRLFHKPEALKLLAWG